MNQPGVLRLRDRAFEVKRAYACQGPANWSLEIECERQEHDGEWWEPRLYHQGLSLTAKCAADLPGTTTSWLKAGTPTYPHPEIGALCVFGHHLVEDAELKFLRHPGGGVSLLWKGKADIFWDDEFGEKVPFECEVLLEVGPREA